MPDRKEIRAIQDEVFRAWRDLSDAYQPSVLAHEGHIWLSPTCNWADAHDEYEAVLALQLIHETDLTAYEEACCERYRFLVEMHLEETEAGPNTFVPE